MQDRVGTQWIKALQLHSCSHPVQVMLYARLWLVLCFQRWILLR